MLTGNRNILNSIKGITSVVKLTAAEKTALADRVLPANVLVVDSSNIVYLTDGVTAVKALNPLLAYYAYDKDVVHLTGDETIAGTKTFSTAIVGSVTGNAGSATKLATARTINGTSFNGTANITTANWGTARNISITDGTNTSTAVSVNGSANVSLKLPATIEANLTGNSDTATKATQDSAGQQIDATYIKGLAVSGRTITYTKGDGTTGTITTQDTNTDTKVTNTLAATTKAYVTGTTSATTNTGTQVFDTDVYLDTVAGQLVAKTFKGSLAGNASSASTATKLQTACTINGTSFNGTANITTANWGTARDITIADSTGDNTGEAISVNGSAAVTLKLPATIKASLDGNAATATSATTAASATTATNATNAAKLGNIASSGYVQTGNVNQTIDGTKTFSAAIASSVKTNTYIDGNKGVAIINSTASAGYNMLYRIKSTNGVFTGGVYNQSYELHYTVDTTIAANTNAVTYTTTLMNEAGDATFAKNVTINVGLTVKGDANFANITASYITGLFA